MSERLFFATRARRLGALPLGRLAVPLLLWGLFITYHYLNISRFLGEDDLNTPFMRWGFTLKETLAAMLGYYFFSWVVLPRWLLQRRWLLTVAGLVVIYYCWALLAYAFFTVADHYGAIHRVGMNNYFYRILDKGLWTGVFAWYGVSIGLNDFCGVVMPPLVVRFVQFLLVSANRSLRLQRENLNLEISFLKAQVNPHFLFNTLNNLYTLVVKQDARAPLIVQHLTDLMHYTVYESNASLAPLTQEIAFLTAYLELERLRYGPKVRIDYRQSGELARHRLTPLLLFPFLENAFKHGVDSSLEASWVEIELAVRGPRLHFRVGNSYSPQVPRREVGGVGLANVHKRLALHYAPTDYELTITQDAATYTVTLTLLLTADAASQAAALAYPPLLPAWLNCLIIDDEPFARELLEGYVAQLPSLHLVASCEHVFEALDVLQKQRIDLLFSDINMPQVNGIEFLRSLPNPPYVIFVTASPHYALEGFELDALDYVVKPVSFPRFMKAVNKAVSLVGSQPAALPAPTPQFLFVKEGNSLQRVLFEEIYYVEGLRDYIRIVLKNRFVVTYLRMSRIEDQLPATRFIRIQKSYLVRLDAVKAITGNEVELYDLPEKLPIGKQYKELLLGKFGLSG